MRNDAWIKINNHLLSSSKVAIIKSAGVYASLPLISIDGQGFLPSNSVLFREARLKLLIDRYIDRDLWDFCIKRFKRNPTGATHTFQFNRKGERPKGGGCMLSMTLVKHNKQWKVSIASRAEEVTMALLADMQFIRGILWELGALLEINLDMERIPFAWHMGLAHQNRTFVPVFMYDAYGKTAFNAWLNNTKPRSEWEKICIDHTHLMIEGKKVTGARKLWGRRLREWTQ